MRLQLYVSCTVHCGTIMYCKPVKCTLFKFMLHFDFLRVLHASNTMFTSSGRPWYINAWKTYHTKLHVQTIFLMMSTRSSKHVEGTKNLSKTLIWKVCILLIYTTYDASTGDLTRVVCRDAQIFVSRQHMHSYHNTLNDTVHLGVCKTTQHSNQAAPMHRSAPLLLDSSSAVFLHGTQKSQRNSGCHFSFRLSDRSF